MTTGFGFVSSLATELLQIREKKKTVDMIENKTVNMINSKVVDHEKNEIYEQTIN
jgi:hypothetical protein